MSLQTLAILGSSLAFLTYGWLSLNTMSMQADFKRFGLEELRPLTGILQLLGGIGLLVGLRWPFALRFSAAGISLLMIAGLIVRLRVGDNWLLCLPAFAFLVLNAYILMKSLN
ncbi:MAG: DoxX family protein [Acidobacteria bacterium]|nr:DoxX family protein [Acidobacteriota bacterium]